MPDESRAFLLTMFSSCGPFLFFDYSGLNIYLIGNDFQDVYATSEFSQI